MSKLIQIRKVPDGVHATLKARAALAGQPLPECLVADVLGTRGTVDAVGK